MTDKNDEKPVVGGKVNPQVITDEMKTSYLNYAMSVIVGRALPDVRDGLKPVHRRVLFAMNDMGLTHEKSFKKSARIVGEVLGKYHPHGDVAVYDTAVRMVQDFSLRYPLIKGQGNFGSIDGDSPAAMRYTEIKLAKIANEMLDDIDKDTVTFTPNFDESLEEPTVLPARLPNLLINGSSGIAVGMATNIPPHNLREVCEATIRVLETPEVTINELMDVIKGPDFPTAGIIQGNAGIFEAFATGRGRVIIRSKLRKEDKAGKKRIIISEIPYQVNKSQLLEEIAENVKDKKIEGVSDIRDESNREGIRVIIELKRDANAEVVENQLMTHTRLKVTFGIIMLTLVNNQPKVLTLKEIIEEYLKHRVIIITKKTEYELKKAQEKAHILEGLLIALKNIDEVIRKIKASKDADEAKTTLMIDYDLSDLQSKAILEMRLQKLASLEQEKIRQDHRDILTEIKRCEEILASELMIKEIIKKELTEIKEKYGDQRRTIIEEGGDDDIEIEDLIKPEEVVVTESQAGYLKRIPIDTYKEQRRGGKGIIAAETKEEDVLCRVFVANTRSFLLLFTNHGQIHWLKVYKIPESNRYSKGKPVINLVRLADGEKINAIVPVREFDDKHHLLMITKNGVAKKTNLSEYSRPRDGGIIAINLDDKDTLVSVKLVKTNDQIVVGTKLGMAVKFKESDIRPVGRNARGVRGINLKEGDEVIGALKGTDEESILTLTENGYGKRTKIEEYRLVKRGGIGVINIQCSDRNGKVVNIMRVTDEDGILLISKKGIIIRTRAKDLSVIGRNTQGVRLMKLEAGDKVVSAAKVINEEVATPQNVEEV